MRRRRGLALLHLNSLPGLDKLNWLKDSNRSVGWTYDGFSWHNQAGWDCDSLLYLNLRNQVSKPLQWRPGCNSAKKQTWAVSRGLSTYICFQLVFHKPLPRQTSDPVPTEVHKGSRQALRAGWHPAPGQVKCCPLPHSSNPPAPAAQSHQDLCIPLQISGMTSASPGANTAAQIQCHHSRRAWLPPSPGTLTSPSQPAARACCILCPHFLS